MNITVHPFNLTVDVKTTISRAEQVFAVGSIIVYLNAVIPLLITQGASEGDGVDILAFNFMPLNMLFLLNYFISTCLLALRWKRTLHTLMSAPFLLLLTLMIPLSLSWSVNPAETTSGSIGMIGTIMFGVYLASRFSLPQLLTLFCWAYGIIIALSWVFVIALPKYGIMGGVHAGTIRGVFTHKNGLGKEMVLATALYLTQMRHLWNKNRWVALGVVGSLSLVVASTSGGALMNCLMVATIVLGLQVFQLKPRPMVVALILLTVTLTTFAVWFNDLSVMLLEALGKDATLTGRTDIWPYTIIKILERPWLGFGFNGFWHGENGESIFMIRALRWNVPNSHNGFLDFIIQLGFVGFALFCLSIWATLVKGAVLMRNRFSWAHAWPIAFLAYLIIVNFTETTLLSQNSMVWAFFTTATLATGLEFRNRFRLRDEVTTPQSAPQPQRLSHQPSQTVLK